MRLSQLLQDLPARIAAGSPDPEIWSVVDDSRKAKAGSLFVARAGATQDGRAFVADAVARGAVAVLGDADLALPNGSTAARAVAEDPTRAAALVAERFHGNPSRHLRLMGVTGTNGKTTIASFMQQFVARTGDRPSHRCGLIGTVEIDDGVRRTPSALTTPGAIELSELFARMVENGCDYAAMEVSSHALHQGRVAALRFACAVFTNLTGDHLDYHGTMDRYAAAKAMLFESLGPDAYAILNRDDPWAERMAVGSGKRLWCSLADPAADAYGEILGVGLDGMPVRFRGPWGTIEALLPLVGRHNAMNALQAVTAAWTQGAGATALTEALQRCEAPAGRLQPVAIGGDAAGFSVLVDYAHTDDALLNVLTALRPVLPEGGSLRVVFGCGGDRDRTKRPRMAAVACAQADQVIVTSDNPRTEDPQAIIADILGGVPAAGRDRVHVEADRAAAIAWAIGQARRGDVVLIAGKGHEDYQIIGTEKRAFDDRIAAKEALERRVAGQGTTGATR